MKQGDLFNRGMSLKDMKQIQASLEEAHKDDTPFPVVTDSGLTVVGDVNKTEIKSRNYTIEFHFAPSEVEKYGIKKEDIEGYVDGQAVVHMDFEDVTIKPRYRMEIDAALIKILPYFYNLNEETKRIGERSDEEMIDMVNNMCIDIGDDMYNFVAAVLKIDRRIVDNMEWQSVVDTITKIITDFPEVANSSDATFPNTDNRQ